MVAPLFFASVFLIRIVVCITRVFDDSDFKRVFDEGCSIKCLFVSCLTLLLFFSDLPRMLSIFQNDDGSVSPHVLYRMYE